MSDWKRAQRGLREERRRRDRRLGYASRFDHLGEDLSNLFVQMVAFLIVVTIRGIFYGTLLWVILNILGASYDVWYVIRWSIVASFFIDGFRALVRWGETL